MRKFLKNHKAVDARLRVVVRALLVVAVLLPFLALLGAFGALQVANVALASRFLQVCFYGMFFYLFGWAVVAL